ncbi:ABC transporter ATP-binding protein [Dactylosporangium siamense]|uniref:Multidrug ABC transporter ATP-binding protein n=1 Tax=Dactylosporangium siamense TaxID=685454 RepID=A0A919UCW5_9ACTN|nr:ABC transporter ATP-binding protein [Dactylosporangium siamense]GIG47246.1 multidrug ABC transporter ATP-binding protein [Dactylosporangium siamense]
MQAATSRTAAETAIEVERLHKSYGAVQAVTDVSLTVPRGEFIGLLGPNGAGKTTLIEMIEGLRVPDSGTVTVLGRRPYPRDPALLPLIGVQTQKSAFFPHLTAVEHLETVAAFYGLDRGAAQRALAQVGLTDSAGVRVSKVSGGQRQRLAIATALVHQPEVIFLDEPTGALDPQARRDLWTMLRQLKAAGRTIVYTTHHLDEAEELCDRVAILHQGRILTLGTPHELIGRSGVGSRVLLPATAMSAEQARTLDGVDDATVGTDLLTLHTRHLARVLAALGDHGGLDGVQTRSATLEDAYLELIGAQS